MVFKLIRFSPPLRIKTKTHCNQPHLMGLSNFYHTFLLHQSPVKLSPKLTRPLLRFPSLWTDLQGATVQPANRKPY